MFSMRAGRGRKLEGNKPEICLLDSPSVGGNWTKDAFTVMEKVTSGWGQVDDELTGKEWTMAAKILLPFRT
jgi:hypothetical protein